MCTGSPVAFWGSILTPQHPCPWSKAPPCSSCSANSGTFHSHKGSDNATRANLHGWILSVILRMDELLPVFNAFLPLESSEVPLIHNGNTGNNWSGLSITQEKQEECGASAGCGLGTGGKRPRALSHPLTRINATRGGLRWRAGARRSLRA